jgi:rod shape determining protein RodA
VPVTGIPLPFVSYGGTFLLMSWIAVALAVRVASDDGG